MLSDMVVCDLQSGQLYTWSDGFKNKTRCRTSEASPCACKSVASAAFHPAWLAHRAVQALWKARMQVCRWTGPWTQVLSFRELSGAAAADGLRSPEDREQVSGLLANYQRTREILEEISEINRELLRRREAL